MKEKNEIGCIKEMFTIEETAEILGISPQTIRNRRTKGHANPWPIKAKKIGKSVRFYGEHIKAFMESN